MTSPVSSLDKILIGNDAGWLLSFSREGSEQEPTEIGRDQYYAEINAKLPSNLEGGLYTFTIEGLTDEDYGKLAQRGDDAPDTVKLYLYWRDTNGSVVGYLKNLGGLTDSFSKVTSSDLEDFLVAELAIASVSRKAGARRYEAKITAREKIFHKLSRERLCSPLDPPDPLEGASRLCQAHGLSESQVHTYPIPEGSRQAESGENPGDEQQELAVGRTVVETLRALGGRMEQSTRQHYGRGMYLIRDGALYIGVRPIPLQGDAPKDLYLAKGLIEVEALETEVTDENFDYCQTTVDGVRPRPPRRRQFKLTLKGRPDLKPGDVVRFDLPQEEVDTTLPNWTGVIGDLFQGPLVPSLDDSDFENGVLLYVAAVEHKLGRSSGFVSTITGVQIESVDDAWDSRTPRSEEEDDDEGSGDGSIGSRVTRAVNRRMRSMLRSKQFTEVGEVRHVTTTGAEEPPSQTLTVWRGLQAADGRRNRARRLAIAREESPAPASGVAYASPFAWGKCGLVLPRYPGTRVLVTHRHGMVDDPIDVGALWESGHGPDSQPGDYWLILPVGVEESRRSTLDDNDRDVPQEHTGKVSQDLIDADGNRVIEVGQLTIHVGSDALKDAGQRPASGRDNGLNGTQIVIQSDGSVLIKTKDKNIELDAGSGDITMKAKNVNVQVDQKMDVS